MITWMQRHKKYLVVTIWISTIAFVGAGFVGWGNVDLNISRSNYVATVGKIGVSHKEFERAFSNLFAQQNMLNDGAYTQEMAMQQGLDKQALYRLVQQKMLLNYAKDLGLNIGDEQVVSAIVGNAAFADEKGFSAAKYDEVLRSWGMKKSDYEEALKEQILLEKLLEIFANFKLSDEQLKMASALIFAQDKVKIKRMKPEQVQASEEQAKKYYEEHKDEFKSLPQYDLASYALKPEKVGEAELKEYFEANKFFYKNEAGKLMDFDEAKAAGKLETDAALAASEKQAKLDFIALKNGQLDFSERKKVDEKDEILSFVQELGEGVISKPFKRNGEWVIAKIEKIYPAVVREFAEVAAQAKEAASEELAMQQLQERAQKIADAGDFAGEELGWLDKMKNNTNLNDVLYARLLAASAQKDTGVVMDDESALVYAVVQKRFGEAGQSGLAEQLQAQVAGLIEGELLEQLGRKYPVKIYYGGKE